MRIWQGRNAIQRSQRHINRRTPDRLEGQIGLRARWKVHNRVHEPLLDAIRELNHLGMDMRGWGNGIRF